VQTHTAPPQSGTSRPRGSIACHGLENTPSPGNPSEVAGELSVDARNTVDLRAIFVNLVERR
jgi:hypothetical protein